MDITKGAYTCLIPDCRNPGTYHEAGGRAFLQRGREADPSAFRTSPAKQIRQDSGG